MGLFDLFQKKENIKRDREPKNRNKVPTTRIYNRTSRNLVTSKTLASNSASSTPSTFGSGTSRRFQPTNLITSTPKHSVASSSHTKSNVAKGVVSQYAKGDRTITLKSTTELSNLDYISYIEQPEFEIKSLENRENSAENNNNIEKDCNTTKQNILKKPLKTVEKSLLKNHEKNTVSKEEQIVNRPTGIKPVKNDISENNKKGGGHLQLRSNKGLGGLFDVKKRDKIIVDSVAERRIERDKVRMVHVNQSPPFHKVVKSQSTLTLTSVRTRPKLANKIADKKIRPLTIPNTQNIKRGHAKDSPGRDIDNISRTSSVTNLESLESQGRSKPPKKSGSKERVDKDGKKAAPKTNNNQTPPGGPVAAPQQVEVETGFHSHSSDSLDAEVYQLRKQLKDMADEKTSLALQLGEQRGQLHTLHKEIQKLKCFQEESTQEIEKLSEENTTLRNRLRDVAHSPLSDNEKQQILFQNAHMMQSSSAPASIATNILDDTGGDMTACTTPDWDKHSSSNVSEVSVACLQDKINQMQETHYSTNEELQATLQELTDLQRQLTDLQQENERLNEEKTLMFDSLCRQTERLNDSRQEVESLKQLLYRDRLDENGTNQLENAVEREQNLMELLRRAQEEREALLLKLEHGQSEIHESRTDLTEKINHISQLSERVKTLECSMDAKHAEHKQMDQELAQAKDQCSSKQIEINRLTDLLENARTKIIELEQDRTMSDKSELDEMLDNARKEKDQLESEVAYLKEQLARSKNEIEKLKEQVFVLQEECKVTRNNAKTTQSDLEYKCEKLIVEKNSLTDQLQQFQEAVNEFQVQTQCHIEDKRQLSAVLSETQRNLSESERKSLNLETEMQELKKLRAEENDEWEKFQNDLLTSVRVANDFKTEAQQELQKIILENKTYREKTRLLEGQLEKLKGGKTAVETQTEVVLTPHLIHFAKNFEFPPILRQASKRRHKKVLSLDSANMDKLFPVLSKERRSRSKDNLANSKENLNSFKNDSNKSRSAKSIENLLNFDTDSEEILEKSKFKLTKSNENSTDFKKDFHKDLQKPDNREKSRKKSKDSIDSLSSGETLEKKSSDFFSRFVKKRDKKPQNRVLSHPKFMSVEEEMLMQSLDNWYDNIDKTVPDEMLSKEEKAIIKLKCLYEDEQLKEKPVAMKPKEQLAISKPLLTSVVQNPKLDEIVKNRNLPNVEEPLRDSALEEPIRNSHHIAQLDVSPRRSRVKSHHVDKSNEKKWFSFNKSKSLDNLKYFDVEEVTDPYGLKLYRARETDNLTTSDDIILKSPKREFNRYSSEVHPYDSVSNPRYSNNIPDYLSSTKISDDVFLGEPSIKIPEESRHPDSVFIENVPHEYKPKIGNDLPKPNIYINYENLDQIIAEIPKNVPESELNEEQKFALKLKFALDAAEKKTVVKKRKKKYLKNLQISPPTKDSVERNWKLKEIILNHQIKTVGDANNKRFSDFYVDSHVLDQEKRPHSADIEDTFEVIKEFSTRKDVRRNSSKSYQDITFSFAPEEHIVNMLHLNDQKHLEDEEKQHIESVSSHSSCSFTSGEFNLDTGTVSKSLEDNVKISDSNIQEPLVEDKEVKLQREKNSNSLPEHVKDHPDEVEDLFYNETLSKKEKRSSLEPKIDDLGYNETLVKKVGPKATKIDVIEQDPRIEDAQKQYKKDLQEMINRIEVEEKIKPFLHPRLPKHKAQVLHVHYQEPESFVTVFNKEEAVISYIKDNNIQDKNINEEEEVTIDEQKERDDSFISYGSSDISKFLDSSTDSFVLPDSSRDFVHSSGYADQEFRNIFVGLSDVNLESLEPFLEEERKSSLQNSPLDTKNVAVVDRIEMEEHPNDINPDSSEYWYKQMEKENKYGVVSPYEVRYSYKNVVSEIKTKFSREDINVPDYLKEGKIYNNAESKKLTFFYMLNGSQQTENQIICNEEDIEEPVDFRNEGVSQIDKEMQDIMEKYLHTRASLIVKKTYNKNPETDPSLSASDNTSNLKKYENVENLHELKIIEPNICENEDSSRKGSLNDDDLQFIAEMKKKYILEDNQKASNSEEVQEKHNPFTDKEIEERYQSLTNEELALIGSSRERFSRPLSGINERDILLVEELTRRYFDDDENAKDITKEEHIAGALVEQNLPDIVKTTQEIQTPIVELPPEFEESIPSIENRKFLRLSLAIPKTVVPIIVELDKEEETLLSNEDDESSRKNLNFSNEELKMVTSSSSFDVSNSSLSPLSDQEVQFSRTKSTQEFRTSSLKQSLIPLRTNTTRYGSLPPEVRKKKINVSLGSHFQRRSLEAGLTYQPVYGTRTRSSEENTFKIRARSCGSNGDKPSEKEPIGDKSKVPKSTKLIDEEAGMKESNKVEKKPIPRPRIKSQASFSEFDSIIPETMPTNIPSEEPTEVKHDISVDKNENVINMTDNNNKNSSAEINRHSEVKSEENVQENQSVDNVRELQVTPRKFDTSELVQAKVVYLDDSESIIDLVPEKLIQNIKPTNEIEGEPEVLFKKKKHEPTLKMEEDDDAGSSKGTLPSKSSIKILGKREELDITRNLSNSNFEEVPRSNSSIEPSRVNLFKPGSEQSYDSYLELFKSEADKNYDSITGKSKPPKGFIQYAVIESGSDECNSHLSQPKMAESAPKIVDFVPLDDNTKPYFTKDGAASVSSTLEREKTFQILNQAEKIADSSKNEKEKQVEEEINKPIDKKPSSNDKSDLNCSVEFLARTPSNFSIGSSKSRTDASRTSFSQAKKLFEALAEANKTEEKSKPKTPPKYQVRDSKGSELNIPVNKELIGGSKNIVRETVLLIKDGKNVPIEKRSSKNMVRETVLLVQDGKNFSPDSNNQE